METKNIKSVTDLKLFLILCKDCHYFFSYDSCGTFQIPEDQLSRTPEQFYVDLSEEISNSDSGYFTLFHNENDLYLATEFNINQLRPLEGFDDEYEDEEPSRLEGILVALTQLPELLKNPLIKKLKKKLENAIDRARKDAWDNDQYLGDTYERYEKIYLEFFMENPNLLKFTDYDYLIKEFFRPQSKILQKMRNHIKTEYSLGHLDSPEQIDHLLETLQSTMDVNREFAINFIHNTLNPGKSHLLTQNY